MFPGLMAHVICSVQGGRPFLVLWQFAKNEKFLNFHRVAELQYQQHTLTTNSWKKSAKFDSKGKRVGG